MRYQLTDHTADIGIRLSNKTLKGIFEDAAFALFDILCDINKVQTDFERTISVEAINDEELLNLFLSVLLNKFTVENDLINQVKVTALKESEGKISISGMIYGEMFDPARHVIKTEIKAVTFHNLAVKKTKEGYTAEVLFDV